MSRRIRQVMSDTEFRVHASKSARTMKISSASKDEANLSCSTNVLDLLLGRLSLLGKPYVNCEILKKCPRLVHRQSSSALFRQRHWRRLGLYSSVFICMPSMDRYTRDGDHRISVTRTPQLLTQPPTSKKYVSSSSRGGDARTG